MEDPPLLTRSGPDIPVSCSCHVRDLRTAVLLPIWPRGHARVLRRVGCSTSPCASLGTAAGLGATAFRRPFLSPTSTANTAVAGKAPSRGRCCVDAKRSHGCARWQNLFLGCLFRDEAVVSNAAAKPRVNQLGWHVIDFLCDVRVIWSPSVRCFSGFGVSVQHCSSYLFRSLHYLKSRETTS